MKKLCKYCSILVFLGLFVYFIFSGNFLKSSTKNILPQARAAGSACNMQLGTDPVVFCDTFDAPAGIGNRSGDLNGTIWGVSRTTGNVNLGGLIDGWAPTPLDTCSGTVTVKPPNDIQICNGQLHEAVNDNATGNFEAGTVAALTMYPKQPFDFAGRTGTVSFDVGDDTHGSHAAWPEFWMSDHPVPGPFAHFLTWQSSPQYGFGLRFDGFIDGNGNAASCPEGNTNYSSSLTNGYIGLGSVILINNYVVNDFDNPSGALHIQGFDCVKQPAFQGQLNHFEIRISLNQIDVYGTDAGTTTPLKHLATISNLNLGFTRGLIWIDDAHYNADKANPNDPSFSQAHHTFIWDNVAFDGPFTYRDLSYDALDANVGNNNVNSDGSINLGKLSQPNGSATWTTLPIPANPTATAVRVMFNFSTGNISPVPTHFNITVNGNAHTLAWPYPDTNVLAWRTIDDTIPITDLVTGANTVTLGSDVALITANVNIVLVNAGVTPPPPPPGPVPPPPPPDTIPPTVSISSPTSGATVSGSSMAITANASDNVAVAGVQFKLDGNNLGSEDIVSPYAISWDTTTASNGTHVLTAVARDTSNNTTTSAGVSVTVSNAALTCNTINTNTFYGCYYNDQTLTNLVLTRTDAAINFNWGQGSPDPAVNVDHFSAQWQGNFTFNAGPYTFTATADDGVRVWVDNNLIIDEWIDQAPTTYTATPTLTAGTHLVKVQYYDDQFGAQVQVSWTQGGTTPPPTPTPTPTPPGSWVNITGVSGAGGIGNLASECGNLTSISAVPSSSTILAGIALDSLWSNSSGSAWSKIGISAGSATINNRPMTIIYDPTNPSIFWEAGIYGSNGGVYKTTNGGATFTQLGSVTHTDSVSIDFTDPNRMTLVAGGHEQNGQKVYKSTDGGNTWTNIGLNLPAGTGFSEDPLVINSQTYIVNTYPSWGGGTPGIYRTTNGGASWTKVSSEPANQPVLVAPNGTIYYADGNGLVKSSDNGVTWSTVGSGLLSEFRPMALQDGRLVSASSTSLMISSDGGSTWSPIGATLPYAPNYVIYSNNRKAFFISHWDCGSVVLPNAVEELDMDLGFGTNPPPPPPPNQLPVGTFDGLKADGVTLQGWSYDPDSTSASNNVQIYVNGPVGTGTLIFSGPTSILRSDVNTTFGISGNHGFEFVIPAQYQDGLSHSYYVYGIDINDGTKSTLLTGSPKSFTVGGGSTYQRTISIASLDGRASKVVSGTLDVLNSSKGLIKSYAFTTNSSGQATITFDIPIQTVFLKIHAVPFLTRLLSNVNLANNVTYSFPLLLTGDINQDDIVNSIDFSTLNSHWFTSDATSDLNQDGLVNSLDFSLLNKNWFVVGEQ